MRGKPILIVAAIAVVAAGGLYYVLGVHLPGRTRAKARTEIERWEQRMAKVQACLLGDDIKSPDFYEAMAIRELASEVDRRACTAAVGELSRGEAEDTGLSEVEAAWHQVDVAVSAVARGFADSLDRSRSSFDALANALGQLADADRTLRSAAGMDPPPAPHGGKLPTAEIIPIAVGDDKVTGLDAWLRPSSGGMIALVERSSGARNTRHLQIVLVPGEAPRLMRMGNKVRPSITTAAWGAGPKIGADGAVGTELVAGALDADGRVTDGRPFAGADKGARPIVMFALGDAQTGAIAFVPDQLRPYQQLAVARVAGTTLMTEGAHDTSEFAFALDPPDRGLLAWTSGGKAQAMIVRPGPPNRVVDLGPGVVGQSCLTATRGWVTIDREQFVSFPTEQGDDAGAVPHLLPNHDLVGCDKTSVLLSRAGHRYSVCTETCRIVELQAKPLALPALAGGQVIAVATRGQVLAIWREKAAPLYVALPRTIRPKLVHASAKVVDVIAGTDNGMVIARAKL